MKKLFLIAFLIVGLFSSCSIDDNEPNYHMEVLPVYEVDIPDSFVLGETYPIKVYYFRPSSCHSFNGFYYDKELNVRTVAVQSLVVEESNCITLSEELVEASFDFYVTSNGSYVFKFWTGVDETGEDTFLEYEIPVN